MRKGTLAACALLLLPTGCGGPAILGGHSEQAGSSARKVADAYCLTAPCIYVTNAYRPAAVDIYGANERGAAKPIAHIEGPATQLSSPAAVALDASHNVYVAGGISSSQYVGTVTVYAAGNYGNVSPTQTITGPDTRMGVPTGIAVDSAGRIYVANWFAGSACTGSVTVYAAGANGDAPPIAEIKGGKTRLCDPGGVAVDPGGNVYVTSSRQYNSAVYIYAAGANGNVRPMEEISGKRTFLYDPKGIALGARGDVYVSNESDGTLVKFRAGTYGNTKPVQAVYGIRTKLQFPCGISVNQNGDIYTNTKIRGTILVFAPHADGDVPPIRVIRKNTRSNLRVPTNITIR